MRKFYDEGDRGGKKGSPAKTALLVIVLIAVLAGAAAAAYYFLGGFGDAAAPPVPTQPPKTNQSGDIIEPIDEFAQRDGVYTFLFMGVDKGKKLTDVLMVGVYDTNKNTVDILNIPRDTYSKNNSRSKAHKHINQAYGTGGMEQLMAEVVDLVGFDINWYVTVDMQGFVKLINHVGGVDFYVPQNMYYVDESQDLKINLKKGQQRLNGQQALNLVRFRKYSNADIGRIKVRSDFLKALGEQLVSASSAIKAVELAGVVFDNVTTDMSASNLVWFAKKAFALDMENVNFHTLPGGPAQDSGMWIPYKNELLSLLNESLNPLKSPITEDRLDIVQRSENKGK